MTATALRQVVDRRCLDEKGFASELFHELAWWKEVRPLTSFVDAVVQPHRRDIDHYDAYVLSIIWSWLQSGRLVRAFKSIGVTPCRDACASENQRSLNGVFGITAKVVSGPGGSDGYVELTEPLAFRGCGGEGNEVTLPAGTVFPLEVGSTSAATTYLRLFRFDALARWPYHDSRLHLWWHAGCFADLIVDELLTKPPEDG